MHTGLSHVDESGKANMVDVTLKQETMRQAIAQGAVSVSSEVLVQIQKNQLIKGDVLSVARIAGIQAAKKCADLIPLCHPLLLTKVQIDFELDVIESQVSITCLCKLKGNTGIEMEALTGVSVAALTIFDMCKALDPSMTIHSIRVLEKKGGKTGDWQRTKT
ncbi:cyclic pyranopterin monophosphate synthase MoaC [Aliiglaciecola litoralis]